MRKIDMGAARRGHIVFVDTPAEVHWLATHQDPEDAVALSPEEIRDLHYLDRRHVDRMEYLNPLARA